MDDIDRAVEQEAAMRDAAISTGRGILGKGLESAPYCVACGEPIPQARRIALPGVSRCVQCQEGAELMERQLGRSAE